MELWQVIIAIVASNGFWAYLTLRTERDSSEKKMRGLDGTVMYELTR